MDCPQCGRSLRVPDLDGRTRSLQDPASSAKQDSELLSALSELSVLNEASDDVTADDAPDSGSAASKSVVSLEPVSTSEPVDIGVQPVTSAPVAEDEPEEPVAIQESLEELASFGTASGPNVSGELLSEMKQLNSGRISLLLTAAGILLLLAAGFAGGWFAAGYRNGATETETTQPGEPPQQQPKKDKVEPQLSPDEFAVQGVVRYQDSAGQLQPDDGAVVLLLPAERIGSVKLNARSVRRPADHPDRTITEAALHSIGADAATADENGRFVLTGRGTAKAVVVVVSKHLNRPEDVDPAESVIQILESYFDSTSHICGRLAVQTQAVTGDPKKPAAIEIDFEP